MPEVSFSSNQGQASFSFLGLVSDSPFTSVDIHFATGPSSDGVLIDDLQYAVVPVPAAVWLFISGLFGFFSIARRKKSA